ncbi:MAG TPA: preprotein translocase subunit SecG [SAR86 cluster bacterium]|jgi:preprotein translocase subunit SecG|nr:preprotein translocase subunit SecG [SAR86 cluster bacterium]HJM15405.1 preprotein translocase subunit SecG [SAR86 cluster bacterium]|tara:strand:- start:164 stop:469 length:306 start_codon:yes stop_codon:yes gene_type:complete
MENLLIFFYIVISIALILLVLLQQGKGSDIGSAFGGGSSNAMFGSSGPSNPLTKVTAIVSAIFLILSLSITYISRNSAEKDLEVSIPVAEETGILPDNSSE